MFIKKRNVSFLFFFIVEIMFNNIFFVFSIIEFKFEIFDSDDFISTGENSVLLSFSIFGLFIIILSILFVFFSKELSESFIF